MSSRFFFTLAPLLAALHLASCAGTHPPDVTPAAPATPPVVLHPSTGSHWAAQAGAFHIELIPGDRKKWVETGKDTGYYPASSRYRVTWQGPAGEQRIETESQYVAESMRFLKEEKFYPAQVVLSDAGDALVIDEDIPNDCIACSNFTYIAPDEKGRLTRTYFELPRSGNEPVELSELPRITGVNGQVIDYRYKKGETGSVRVSELKKISRPVPPG